MSRNWVWVVEMAGNQGHWHAVETAMERVVIMRLLRNRQRACPDDEFRPIKYERIEP
jgi:hypothetical protein